MNTLSGQKTTWIPFEEIYKYTNTFTSAVYSFACCDKKPEDHKWPFFTREVFYIGMSGGLEKTHTYDLKNRKKNKGRVETLLHKRMKDHNTKKNGKLKHPWTQNEILNGKKIFVCFIIPNHIDNDKKRNWLSTVESENILYYQQIFGEIPFLNFAEKNDNKKLNANSISQKYMSNISNLDKFYNE